jgi:hypothetical protein
MPKTTQKITLSPSRDIPFNKLVLSQSNVPTDVGGVCVLARVLEQYPVERIGEREAV